MTIQMIEGAILVVENAANNTDIIFHTKFVIMMIICF
jgi:hypothetical protein